MKTKISLIIVALLVVSLACAFAVVGASAGADYDATLTITANGVERDGQGKYVLRNVLTGEIVAGDGVNYIYR